MKDKGRAAITNHDHILHGLAKNGQIRVIGVDVTESLASLKKRHMLDPLATIALGRALSCAAMLGGTLKEDDLYVKCIFQGDGPMRQIVAEYIAPATLRGFVAVPQIASVTGENIPESVGAALGKGTLTIARGAKSSDQPPYSGVTELVSGEIAEDMAHFFANSEQLPSVVAAGVHLDSEGELVACGGVLVQKLGGVDIEESVLSELEDKISKNLCLSSRLAQGESLEAICDFITDESSAHAFDAKPIGFHCFCSKERMALGLISLGEAELKKIQLEMRKIETTCHYCMEKYDFELKDLMAVKAHMDKRKK